MAVRTLLGDEAVALGGIHAGISAAYGYPGTPSTEILEFLLQHRPEVAASWAVNEKTAYEQALGVSMAGRRVLVTMKHVGLNVAADPFVNSALLDINGGLVLAVADDPGMHSSQNEQDSRLLADFARTICLEPHDAQSAYDMTREAFDLSERFHVPVVLRLVTRLAHCRTGVEVGASRPPNPLSKAPDHGNWVLLPANARRRWRDLLDRQADFLAFSEHSAHNELTAGSGEAGVITAGIARHYLAEHLPELEQRPPILHVGTYPLPAALLRRFAAQVRRILVLEDGYPFIERMLRGVLPAPVAIAGRETGDLPIDGELTPDTVRRALGLPQRPHLPGVPVPARTPQLCNGCPHIDTVRALKEALEGLPRQLVASDIGCYTLAALPPLAALDSCVCMGASIGMAKGASDAGLKPTVALIGDSTFLHSGLTPLLDAVAADTDMTVIIADNEVVGMTGGQPTLVGSSRLYPILIGLGVPAEHCHLIEAHPRYAVTNAELIRREIEHPGLSVIVAVRECVESVRARKARAPNEGAVT
ncbi:MAG TPA: thiamine pyrophosphate-dependent enzyme [Vicinamibacterales bacterium]|nr:thiamine pyrophosphate-dependent enzyme [Vicinamibacterales bacterium]